MLDPKVEQHFRRLWGTASANERHALDERQRAFDSEEASLGRRPGGDGYRARLAAVYAKSVESHATAIIGAVTEAHRDFRAPVDDAIVERLAGWGREAMSGAYEKLEGAYARHLGRLGVPSTKALAIDQVYKAECTRVANSIRDHLWGVKNVPAKKYQPEVAGSRSTTFNFHGPVGAVQTGDNATASVQQQWIAADTQELQEALRALRDKVDHGSGVSPEVRGELVVDIDSVDTELRAERPNVSKIAVWLGRLGKGIEVIASLQPAYEAVMRAAKAIGIPL